MMSDSEKIALIDLMIADFWEYLKVEQQEKAAFALVTSIATVINFNTAINLKGKE